VTNHKISKIAILGNRTSPHVVERAERLRKDERLSVKIFDGSIYRNSTKNKKPFLNWVEGKIPKLSTILWLKRRYVDLRLYDPDLIFIMYADPYSLLLASILDKRYIVSAWGGDLLSEQGALNTISSRAMTRRGLSKADAIYTVSEHLKESISELMGNRTYPEPNVQYYGIDLKKYEAEPAGMKQVNREKNIIFYSPRWALPIYNIKTVVNAFINLHKKTYKISLIYRDRDLLNSEESIKYGDSLKEKIKQANLADKTKAVGLLSEEQRIDMMKECDIVLSFSESDGTPLSLLEAMASGKIVVCHRIPSIQDLIDHGNNGFLVDQNNMEEVVELLYHIIQNFDSIVSEVGNAARKFAEDYADLELEIDEYKATFKKIITK